MQQLLKEDVDYLLAEGYVQQTKADFFGKIPGLTEKANFVLGLDKVVCM